jgi:hypothetical protein
MSTEIENKENLYFTEQEIQDIKELSIPYPRYLVDDKDEVVRVSEVVGLSGIEHNNGVPLSILVQEHVKGQPTKHLTYVLAGQNVKVSKIDNPSLVKAELLKQQEEKLQKAISDIQTLAEMHSIAPSTQAGDLEWNKSFIADVEAQLKTIKEANTEAKRIHDSFAITSDHEVDNTKCLYKVPARKAGEHRYYTREDVNLILAQGEACWEGMEGYQSDGLIIWVDGKECFNAEIVRQALSFYSTERVKFQNLETEEDVS